MSSHFADVATPSASAADPDAAAALLAARALVREALAGHPVVVDDLDRLATRAEHHGWDDVATVTDVARVLVERSAPTAAVARLVERTAASGDPVRQVLAEVLGSVVGADGGRAVDGEIDTLTGLPDRSGLVRRMAEIAEPSRADLGVSVVAVDVDDMKRINAQYGQEVGDEVLMRVAGAIRNVVRDSDLVARWSEDEFLVVMQTQDREAAGRRCREIAATVRSDPWDSLAPGLDVTVSAGLASGTVGKLREVRDDAALALERAKARGGNRIAY